ncbi:hypothetical protein [Paenarthrobacter sp. CAP02]|uniref:hypothetical protein n=1 Tax=Paenarthrobacter sp. CAP02 TaxID=3158144 RepID=UPI0032DACEF5
MQTLENGVVVPTNSDPYNLTDDLANAFKKTNGAVRVSSQAQRDALTKYTGLKVQRLDLPGQPEDTWDGTNWLPLAPVTLSFTSTYRQAGTWFTDALRPASVSRIGRRVYLAGALANDVPVNYTANTAYTLATFPVAYAPKTYSEPFVILTNAYQANVWVTPAGEVKIYFLVTVPSQAVGTMVFPLSGMSWNS